MTRDDESKEPLLEVAGLSASAHGRGKYGPGAGGADDDQATVVGYEHEVHRRQSSWAHASFLIAGEIVGMGIMGLPYATSQLGWAVGLGMVALFALLSWYSGVLLARVRNELSPQSRSYAEAARDLVGPRFGTFTEYAIMVNWAVICPYFLMAAANALVLAYDLCYYQWAAVLLGVLFLFAQLRTLHALHLPALASIVAVMVVLAVILLEFGLDGRAPAVVTRVWPPTQNVTFLGTYNHMSSFIFAYQGQSMFFEIMREMKDSTQFTRSLGFANVYMMLLYGLTAALAYHYKGEGMQGFLPDSLRAKWARILVAVLLVYHVIIAFMLTAQPLAEQIQRKVWPASVADRSWRGQSRWALIQGLIIAVSYLVANAIPFFADFQNIIGAALGAPIMFGWPVLFYVFGMFRQRRPIPVLDRALCVLFLGLLTPFCMGVGVVAAVRALLHDWNAFGKPFSCHLVGY